MRFIKKINIFVKGTYKSPDKKNKKTSMRNLINKILLVIIGIIGYSSSSYACHKHEKSTSCTKSESTIKIGKAGDFSCMYGVPKSNFETLDTTKATTKSSDKKRQKHKIRKKRVTQKNKMSHRKFSQVAL